MLHKHQQEKQKTSSAPAVITAITLGLALFSFGKHNFDSEVGGALDLGPPIHPKILTKLRIACQQRDANEIKRIIPDDVEDFIAREYLTSNKIPEHEADFNNDLNISFNEGLGTVKRRLGKVGEGIKLDTVIIGCTEDYLRQFDKARKIQESNIETWTKAEEAYKDFFLSRSKL